MSDASPAGPVGIPQIRPSDLPDDAPMLDVREDEEWAAGRSPGARHIPLGELPQRLSELDREARQVVVCRSGGRSARAVGFLRAQGFDAVNLDGGMQAWHAAARPMEHDGDGAPSVG